MSLAGKRIIVGVCGGIAAYKSAFLIRLLIKAGAEVRVVMTPDAANFVGPLTFSALSKNPVATQFFDPADDTWNNHVELGLWGDIFIIAPATANTLAKMSTGICDNILLAVYLSARSKVIVAPAMDLDMWKHPATQHSIQNLKQNKVEIVYPESGELASGLEGEGRMAEPMHILQFIQDQFSSGNNGLLSGKKILITAGPTYEKIDPVRFIGNYSSGKMGFALAEECAAQGADVTVVHGPVHLDLQTYNRINLIAVESAAEMYGACKNHFSDCDIFIAAAAVADFTPSEMANAKIKKNEAVKDLTISLKQTKDILAEMSSLKKTGQLIVGFALETDNAIENAKIKLQRKNLDLIVLNSLQDAGAGFGHDTNRITLLDKNNNQRTFELKSKRDAARDIVHYIHSMIHA